MKPTVGRIVHWYRRIQMDDLDKQPLAALITHIPPIVAASDGPWVGLCIFNPNGTTYGLYPFSETPKPGYWSWPPKV